jgi:hypothetical protein
VTARSLLRTPSLLAVTLLSIACPALSQEITIYADFAFPGGCILPESSDPLSVPFSGISAWIPRPLPEVLAVFPAEWEGRPRIRVGLDVRPPGLRLRFAERTGVGSPWIPWAELYERLVIEPELPASVDSVFVNWYPLPGSAGNPSTYYPGECMFMMPADREVLVFADAIVNLLGLYATPGDTVEVWGTEVGIPDVPLQANGLTVPIAVEEATWGAIKANWR